MKYTIFDKETDGLYDDLTKIHCLGYRDYEDGNLLKSGVITDYNEMRTFYAERSVLVCHNLRRFDIPVAKKILGVDYQGQMIDTLGISWHMFPMKGYKHGLGAWGEKLGFGKPPIEDYENLPLERYIERVEGDVEINSRLFHEQLNYLKELYSHGGDLDGLFRYISFKMDCLWDQETEGIPLDLELCTNSKEQVDELIKQKVDILAEHMPKVIDRTIPKKPYKQDGMLSKLGEKWMEYLKEKGLPEDTRMTFKNGNPGSPDQIKAWLFELGWIPRTFKVSKSTGMDIPQISLPFGQGICPSIEDMYDDYPMLEELGGLYMLKHRSGLFKSFIEEMDESGRIYASAHGFTNTMRFKHVRPVANLPKVSVPWGKEIRGCFKIPDDKHIMCGSDISGLEDNTKQHYIYFYDPEYVEEMRVPGFDAHIDIGKLAGLITEEEEIFFRECEAHLEEDRDYFDKVPPEFKVRYKAIKKKRATGKTVNFCLPVDTTQVLTKEGWKEFDDLSVGDMILSKNEEDSIGLEFVPILELPVFENQETVLIQNKWFQFESTSNHRWLVDKRVRSKSNSRVERKYVTTDNLVSDCSIIRSSEFLHSDTTGKGIKNCAVLGWLLADGHLEYDGNAIKCSIAQKKYHNELRNDLENMDFIEDVREDGVRIFRIRAKSARLFLDNMGLPNVSKHDIDYTKLIMSLGNLERKAFIHAFWLADGGWHGNSKAFYQNRGRILDALLLALTLDGKNYTINSNGTYKNHENVNVYVSNRNHTTCQKIKRSIARNTTVFCVNNRNSNFIARQGDIVTITGNSATYGAGGPKIAAAGNMTVKEGYELHKIYWTRNAAVKKTAKACKVVKVKGQKWLYNPVSGFWMFLKAEKDRFSTLNQSTGVYVFDSWLRKVRENLSPYGIKVIMQYHDEIMLILPKGYEDIVAAILRKSMQEVNEQVKLNVEIGISVEVGKNYADCH